MSRLISRPRSYRRPVQTGVGGCLRYRTSDTVEANWFKESVKQSRPTGPHTHTQIDSWYTCTDERLSESTHYQSCIIGGGSSAVIKEQGRHDDQQQIKVKNINIPSSSRHLSFWWQPLKLNSAPHQRLCSTR